MVVLSECVYQRVSSDGRVFRRSECVHTHSLGHVLGELHEVLALLQGQQREDAAVAVHALLMLAQAHVEARALPQVAHVGGVVLYGWKEAEGVFS